MTEEDLFKLETLVREHKQRGMSSNITLKINQVEALLNAAREGLPDDNVIDLDIRAQARLKDLQQNKNERRYLKRWSNAQQLFKVQKEILDQRKARLEARKQQKLKNIEEKWTAYKSYVGNQNQKASA